jgi:hypothetical protein
MGIPIYSYRQRSPHSHIDKHQADNTVDTLDTLDTLDTYNSIYTDTNIDTMINTFEDYFEEHSIYKTLFICSCDKEVMAIEDRLLQNNHAVATFYYNDIYDDHYNYLHKFKDFNTEEYRVFLMSYQTWFLLNSETKVYLLPYQNLVTFGNISDDGIRYIKDWLYNARQSGFIDQEPRVLELSNEYTH